MFSVFKEQPQILNEAKKAKYQPKFILQILIFIAILLVTGLAQFIPMAIYGLIYGVTAAFGGGIPIDDPTAIEAILSNLSKEMVLPTLISTCAVTILVILYCTKIERRSLFSMGFTRRGALREYGVGLLIGLVMFGLCVLIALLSGSLEYNGFILGNRIILLLAFLFAFVLQGMSEEVMLRGYFMVSISNKNSILLAVLTNSLLFAMLHLGNTGITLLAFINLALFGLFASVYMLKTNNIWGISAIHTIWNFAQGNIFGIKVSGIDTQVSLFSFVPKGTSTLINGGIFGLEGGLAVTLILVISVLITLKRKGSGIVVRTDTIPADDREGLPV